jgi:hypothetical protein
MRTRSRARARTCKPLPLAAHSITCRPAPPPFRCAGGSSCNCQRRSTACRTLCTARAATQRAWRTQTTVRSARAAALPGARSAPTHGTLGASAWTPSRCVLGRAGAWGRRAVSRAAAGVLASAMLASLATAHGMHTRITALGTTSTADTHTRTHTHAHAHTHTRTHAQSSGCACWSAGAARRPLLTATGRWT